MAEKVDVFIPTWNSGKTLEATLDSLLVAGIPINRLIVTDVSSQDNTREILERWCRNNNIPLVFVNNPPGLGDSRILAETSLVETPIYASIDSDIILLPGWFEKLYKRITEDKDLAIVSGYVLFGDRGSLISKVCEFQRRQRYYQPCLGDNLIRKGVADFTVMKGQKIGEDTVLNRYMVLNGKKYAIDHSAIVLHPRERGEDLKHLVGWGKGAREMGRRPLIEFIRFCRAIVTAPLIAYKMRDWKLLFYHPYRELYHFYGFMIGETRPDVQKLSIREELRIILRNKEIANGGK